MARTPLLETVQRAAAEAAAEDRSTTRRGFLRDAAVAGAATTAFGVFAQRRARPLRRAAWSSSVPGSRA